jgi:AcrR family transcriptional regulator
VDDAVRTATIELLGEVGYRNLAIEQVSQRAGVGKSAIYRRWRSKAEMVFSLVMRQVDPPAPPDTGTLHGDLGTVTRSLMDHCSTPAVRAMLPGLISDLGAEPTLMERFASAFGAGQLECTTEALRHAVHRGELRSCPDPTEVHMLLAGPIFIWFFAYGRSACPRYADRLTDAVTAAVRSLGELGERLPVEQAAPA